jgi:hypothetical protein
MSAKGINEEGSRVAMHRFFDLALEFEPINAGDMKTGNVFTYSKEEILDNINDQSIVHAVYADEQKVAMLLERLKEEDLGLSIVVTGLFDRVKECAHEAGIRQHTAECSLGIWGDMEKLPRTDVLEVTTMCGHGMVSSALVRKMANQVRRGKISVEEAARELARPCACGVFNPLRAESLFNAIAARDKDVAPLEPGQTATERHGED